MTGQAVTCHRCGAGTPLPEDLRTPAFQCRHCGQTLSTAAYAGQSAVAADQLRAHLLGVVADPRAAMQNAGGAPRFRMENAATQAGRCVHCGGPIAVPLNLHAKTVDCPGCRRTQPITTYISDKDRFMKDMVRQLEGNAALRQLRAAGVPCPKCGASNPVPDAVARARMKHGLQGFREALADRARRQARLNLVIVAVVVGVATVGALVAALAMRGR